MLSHHLMGLCPFATPDADIKVTPTKTGVTIAVSASDPTAIARIQKKAQILQLMHELHALGPEHPDKSQASDESTESTQESQSDQESQPAL